MTLRNFTVPGNPEPWRRARTSNGRYFTDVRTMAAKDTVVTCFKHDNPGATPFQSDVRMQVTFFFAAPHRLRIKKHADALAAERIGAAKRPDIDNLCKICLDALNGVAYLDDAQVVMLQASKRYSMRPRIECSLSEPV